MEMELPRGFRYGGMAAGIKPSGKLDLSLVAADGPAIAAGVYTQNIVRAASIDWCRQRTPSDQIQAVIVNSGNANACTGVPGQRDNHRLAQLAAAHLGCQADQVLVLSTGVIGKPLPMPRIEAALATFPTLESTWAAFHNAADGITTTDHSRKVSYGRFAVEGGEQDYHVAVMAKGAGMIGPNMATMLAIVVTDFPLTPAAAQRAVKQAADASFNRISVEGHTSTNDALLLLSSAAAQPATRDAMAAQQATRESAAAQPASRDSAAADLTGMVAFQETLNRVCLECAKLIPSDGEGATHLIDIQVRGAADDHQADRLARAIANSALVKTAMHGNDPNWGRIVSAAGYAGVPFDADQTELRLNGHVIFRDGQPASFDPATVSRSMRDDFVVHVQLTVGPGPGEARHYTSDLTVAYVKFNSEYTT